MKQILLTYTIRCKYRVPLSSDDPSDMAHALEEAFNRSGAGHTIGVDPESIHFTVEEEGR